MNETLFIASSLRRSNAINYNQEDSDNDQSDIDDTIDELHNEQHRLTDNSGSMKKRKIPRVIRFRNYNILQDMHNHFREVIMLFHPWRNETDEIENVNCVDIYQANQITIDALRAKYVTCNIDLNEICELLQTERDIQDNVIIEDLGNSSNEINPPLLNNPFEPANDIEQNIMVNIGEEIPVDT